MTLSVIVPIYDIESHLKNFINSMSVLIASSKKGSGSNSGRKIVREIILINNNPKKDIRKVSNININLPNLKIIQNKKNIGYGSACNQGIKMANGRYMLILNPDINISLKALKILIKALKQNKKANIISCKLLNEDGSLQHSCKRFPTLRALLTGRLPIPFRYFFKKQSDLYNMDDYDHKTKRQVDWVSGALMLMKRKYYFDERYFMYFEDIDLCRRIGGVYYYPLVSAVHIGERQSAKDIRLFFSHLISTVRYYFNIYNNKSR